MPALLTRMSTGPVSRPCRGDGVAVGHVGDDRVGGAALLLDLAHDLAWAVLVQVVDPHLGAGAGAWMQIARPTPAAARSRSGALGDGSTSREIVAPSAGLRPP